MIYDIVVANQGPNAANGARARDPLVTGLSCSSVACASATGGATCPGPAPLGMSDLQGAGLVVPVLPAGGVIGLVLTCTASP